MTDFAALGRAYATGFAGGVRREVVVQHEAVGIFALQRVDFLLVTRGAQGRHHQRLGFATGEQGGTVGARQYAGTDGDRAHGAGIATVDARFAVENLAAHDLGFQVLNRFLIWLMRSESASSPATAYHYAAADFIHLSIAGLLLLDLIGLATSASASSAIFATSSASFSGAVHSQASAATSSDQFIDGVDGSLQLIVTEHHCAQHDFFRQLLRFGFDHQHGVYRYRQPPDPAAWFSFPSRSG